MKPDGTCETDDERVAVVLAYGMTHEELARQIVMREARLAEAEALADKWRMMERPYIGGYEKGPNPSYLCRHRYRLMDCITCLNEHLADSATHRETAVEKST